MKGAFQVRDMRKLEAGERLKVAERGEFAAQ